MGHIWLLGRSLLTPCLDRLIASWSKDDEKLKLMFIDAKYTMYQQESKV